MEAILVVLLMLVVVLVAIVLGRLSGLARDVEAMRRQMGEGTRPAARPVPPPAPAPAPAHAPMTTPLEQREIKIVSHSMLFYWWPVWAVGIIMAILTFIDGHLAGIVPPRTEAHRSAEQAAEARQAQTQIRRLTCEAADLSPRGSSC